MITTITIFILILIFIYGIRQNLLQQINKLSSYYKNKFNYLYINDINSLKYNETLVLLIIIINLYLLIFNIVSTNILYNPCFYMLCVNVIYSLYTTSKLLNELKHYNK